MEIYASDFVRYKTLKGKDDWLYIWDMDGITEIVTGKTRYDSKQLAMVCRTIELRQQWCKSRGIQYLHTVAPDKSSIYPEFLPEGVNRVEGILEQFAEAIRRYDVRYIDSVEVLKALKVTQNVYFKTDSHWTYEAAYKVLQELMGPIAVNFPKCRVLDEDQIKRREVNRVMELSALLPEPYKEESVVLEPINVLAKLIFQTDSARGKIQVFETGKKDLPRCVIFRDSFSSFFLNILKESFSRIVVLNSRIFWYDLIEVEKPDVVLVEVAERYLHPLTLDINPNSFEDVFKVSIESIAMAGELHGQY